MSTMLYPGSGYLKAIRIGIFKMSNCNYKIFRFVLFIFQNLNALNILISSFSFTTEPAVYSAEKNVKEQFLN